MRKDKYFVILKALEVLLQINKDNSNTKLAKAKNNLIDSTVKMIKEITEEE